MLGIQFWIHILYIFILFQVFMACNSPLILIIRYIMIVMNVILFINAINVIAE